MRVAESLFSQNFAPAIGLIFITAILVGYTKLSVKTSADHFLCWGNERNSPSFSDCGRRKEGSQKQCLVCAKHRARHSVEINAFNLHNFIRTAAWLSFLQSRKLRHSYFKQGHTGRNWQLERGGVWVIESVF